MALGKPVVGFIRPDFEERARALELPLVRCTKDDVGDVVARAGRGSGAPRRAGRGRPRLRAPRARCRRDRRTARRGLRGGARRRGRAMREHLRKLTGESVVYGLGTAAGRGLQMLLVPVFTRVLAPEAYGVIDLLGLVGSIAALLVVMGTDAALARFFYDAADREARRIMISSSALWRVGVCSVVALTLWMLAPAFSGFLLGSGDYREVRAAHRARHPVHRVLHVPERRAARHLPALEVHRAQPGEHDPRRRAVHPVRRGGGTRASPACSTAGCSATRSRRAFGFVLIRLQLVPRFDRVVLRRMLALRRAADPGRRSPTG